MNKPGILLVLLLLGTGAVSDLRTQSLQPAVEGHWSIDGTPFAESFRASILQNTARENPELLVPPLELNKGKQVSHEIGDTREFKTIDFKNSANLNNPKLVKVTAELRAVGAETLVWVEEDEFGSNVSQSDVDAFLNAFELQTPSDPGRGIKKVSEDYFGTPADIDGDGLIWILILDIRDDFDGSGGFIGGYFSSIDRSNQGNDADIIYVDSNPSDPSSAEALGTVAHEYQHLIHYENDADENLFINEGLSEYAQYICGYGARTSGYYLNHPNDDFTSWSQFGTERDPDGNLEVFRDVDRMILWMIYVGQQQFGSHSGKEFIRELAEQAGNGINGIDRALENLGAGITFEDLYSNWAIALVLNDRSVNAKYGFQEPFDELHAVAERSVEYYPVYNLRGSLKRYSFTFRQFSNGEEFSFELDDKVSYFGVRHDENSVSVSAVAGAASFPNETRQIDLITVNTGGSTAEYEYDADAGQLDGGTLLYHDGTRDIALIINTGISAIRFLTPFQTTLIEQVSFQYSSSQSPTLRFYRESAGQPAAISGAIKTLPATGGQIQTVKLDVSDLNLSFAANEPFYVGLEGVSGTIVGYDGSVPHYKTSYFSIGGSSFVPLWTLQTGPPSNEQLVGNWIASVSGRFSDGTPTTLGLAVLQNPIYNDQLSVLAMSGKPIKGARGSADLNGNPTSDLYPEPTNTVGDIWSETLTLGAPGSMLIDIEAYGRYDLAPVSKVIQIELSLITFKHGGVASGPGDGFRSVFESGALKSDLSVAVIDGKNDYEYLSLQESAISAMRIGPKVETQKPIRLEWQVLSLHGADRSDYQIYRLDGESWTGISTVYDDKQQLFAAYSTQTGLFRLDVKTNEGSVEAPKTVFMHRNYPNPFNPSTTIRFDLFERSPVKIQIYNILGQLIRVLLEGVIPPGSHFAVWDGKNGRGLSVGSGVYFYRLSTPGSSLTQKMMLIQ